MKSLIILLVVLLSTLSCLQNRPYEVTLHRYGARSMPTVWQFKCNFPIQHRKEIREGFDWWDNLTHNHLFLEIPCTVEGADLVVDYSSDYYQKNGLPELNTWGMGYPNLMTFYKPWLDCPIYWSRENVIKHELGHILGFSHSNNPDCLMAHYIGLNYLNKSKNLCPTEELLFKAMYD